jgi:hypothetical protein
MPIDTKLITMDGSRGLGEGPADVSRSDTRRSGAIEQRGYAYDGLCPDGNGCRPRQELSCVRLCPQLQRA